MNESLPIPETTALETTAAPMPQYWEYVAGSYAVVGLVMLWLLVSSYRKRIALRQGQHSK